MYGCEHGVLIMEHRQLCFSLGNGRESWRKPSGRATIRALLSLFLCLSPSFCSLTCPYQGSAKNSAPCSAPLRTGVQSGAGGE